MALFIFSCFRSSIIRAVTPAFSSRKVSFSAGVALRILFCSLVRTSMSLFISLSIFVRSAYRSSKVSIWYLPIVEIWSPVCYLRDIRWIRWHQDYKIRSYMTFHLLQYIPKWNELPQPTILLKQRYFSNAWILRVGRLRTNGLSVPV